MASFSSGTSPQIQNPNQMMDQRKRKRMQSNRESARRSRMKKQRHLDDLTAQISQISKENNHILNTINVSSQKYAKVEAENSILRAQMTELSHRLQSLNEILNYINSGEEFEHHQGFGQGGFLNVNNNNSWNLMGPNQHPIMASADQMFDYYY